MKAIKSYDAEGILECTPLCKTGFVLMYLLYISSYSRMMRDYYYKTQLQEIALNKKPNVIPTMYIPIMY